MIVLSTNVTDVRTRTQEGSNLELLQPEDGAPPATSSGLQGWGGGTCLLEVNASFEDCADVARR